MGAILSKIYPGERPDNFFVYEQFLVSLIWNAINCALFLLQEIYDDQTKQALLATQQISQTLLIMFELTLPLYVIQTYGYPDDTIEKISSSDTSIYSDRLNQSTAESSISKTTSDSLECTMRSQLEIDEIMSDNNFRALFSQYLGREFQMEVFLFFDVLHYYKEAIAENSKMFAIEDTKLIIDEFIADDAVNKLPISDTIRERILDDFSKLGDVENPLDVASIFQPAIDNLKIQLSFHVHKFNMNV